MITRHDNVWVAGAQALVTFAGWVGWTEARAQQLRLEYPEGPVIGSNRVVGLGGAYTGVAEGADGHVYNPSSFAYRYSFTTHQDVDWDWTLYSLNVPGNLNPDLYGPPGTAERTSSTGFAIDLKIHAFGFGMHGFIQDYLLEPHAPSLGSEAPNLFVSTTFGGLGAAFVVTNIDVRLGAYLYVFDWSVIEAVPDVETGATIRGTQLVQVSGMAARVGALWEPTAHPLRIGVTLRPPFGTTLQDVTDADFLAVTPVVYQPAQVTVGASVQLWDRPFNPPKTWGLKRFERLEWKNEPSAGRRYVMLAADVVVTGGSPNAYSVREFFRGALTPAGERATIGLRAGVESELIANWLALRGGGYSEPARTDVVPTRFHGTAGLSVRIPVRKLLKFWPWDLRADGALDLARKFRNFGVGVGIWH